MSLVPAHDPELPGRPPLVLVRVGPFSFRANLRVVALVAGAAALLAALALWGLTLGDVRFSWSEIAQAIAGQGPPSATFIVRDLRLPRILAALLVGPMLAMAGAIFQGLVRNPLVAPDVIGINAGASAAAVLWIVTRKPPALVPVAAFLGAVAAAAAIYLLTWRGRIATGRLIVVGIGVNALLTAATTFLLVQARIQDAGRAVLWMTGSLYAADWADVRLLAAALAVLGPLGATLMPALRVLQLGDLGAAALGMRVERRRLALLLVGCALAAVAVSVAGPVGFVALMVPHAARLLAGPMTGGVFLFTGLLGGLLLLGADLVAQHGLPASLPVGVVTAVLGAPYFLAVLYRSGAKG